jgi:perosamine synthetase
MTIASADTPAIAGGKPIKSTPYTKLPRYGEEELTELREAIAQQNLFYAGGKKVKELEKQFATLRGATHAIACSSGTAAIHAATIAAGVSPDDEVIVPCITDMGTILPVMWQGAVPIFADLDAKTYNLDPTAIEAAITPKTRAIHAQDASDHRRAPRGQSVRLDGHESDRRQAQDHVDRRLRAGARLSLRR